MQSLSLVTLALKRQFPYQCTAQVNGEKTMNVILIDGTWSNSQAMFKRLKVI